MTQPVAIWFHTIYNSFFVLKELINKININLPISDNLIKFTDVKFNVLKDNQKNNVSINEVQELIKDIKVYDLKNKELNNFSDVE